MTNLPFLWDAPSYRAPPPEADSWEGDLARMRVDASLDPSLDH